MGLIPIKLKPGLYRNGTEYQAKGRWREANLIRFAEDSIRPIGGWAVLSDSTGPIVLTGKPRGVLNWSVSGGRGYLAFGTVSKLYVYSLGTVSDITPAGFTTGNDNTTFSAGFSGVYGKSYYGALAYGVGNPLLGYTYEADMWHLDAWGDYLVGCMVPSDGKIYYWPNTGVAQLVANAPTGNRGIVVTPERFLVALGAGGNARLLQWPDRESLTDWTPSGTNQAGDYTLDGQGRLMAGRRGLRETILWTDKDVYAMTYLGGTAVYGFDRRGSNCGTISPQAMSEVGPLFVWMGQRGFFKYDGYTTPLECEVQDFVFTNLNYEQSIKVSSFVNPTFNEVWWLYPSVGSNDPDSYVVWNYRENHWCTGTLDRVCGSQPSASFKYPILVDSSGNVYQHELAWNRGGATPYLESGPIEIGQGDKLFYADQLVPDEQTLGDVNATFYTRLYPKAAEETHGPYTLSALTDVRISGRQMVIRLTEVRIGDWRVGDIRFNAEYGEGR